MPPRKRAAKQPQQTDEDKPNPQKRQKKSQEEVHNDEPATSTNPQPAEPVIEQKSNTANGDTENGQPVAEEDDYEEPAETTEEPLKPSDLYLDTVNRATLDFDFEKVCSVSLSNINIYGCLVCGKYFQGRSKLTPAFAHSIHDDHHVFINLETSQVSVILQKFLSRAF